MPSPIAHAAMGLAIYEVARHHMADSDESQRIGPISGLMAATIGFSLLPDVDVVPAILTGNFAAFHNNFTHSLFFGLLMALCFAATMFFLDRKNVWRWLTVALGCYWVHVGMDFLTPGRGVMVLWPFIPERLEPSFFAFYGVHWSEPLTSTRHLLTLVTEGLFVSLVGASSMAYRRILSNTTT